MHTAGIILIALGSVLTFASMAGVAMADRKESSNEISALELVDWLFLNRAFDFCTNLVRGISIGIKDKSSASRPVLILLCVSICLLVAGIVIV